MNATLPPKLRFGRWGLVWKDSGSNLASYPMKMDSLMADFQNKSQLLLSHPLHETWKCFGLKNSLFGSLLENHSILIWSHTRLDHFSLQVRTLTHTVVL